MTLYMIRLIILFTFLFTHDGLIGQTVSIAVSDVKITSQKFHATSTIIKEHMEKSLLEHDFITVVDRENLHITESERNIQKKESFIDGKYVEQDRAVGAEWMMEMLFDDQSEILTLQLLDVETGEMFVSNTYEIGRFLLPTLEVERPNYFGRYIEEKVEELMEDVDLGNIVRIQVIEIGETDGDKAKEVVLYCKEECKLKRKMKLSVYKEESNKKSLYKKKILIGEVEVIHVENAKVFVAKVKDGEKEILSTFNKGEKLICIHDK